MEKDKLQNCNLYHKQICAGRLYPHPMATLRQPYLHWAKYKGGLQVHRKPPKLSVLVLVLIAYQSSSTDPPTVVIKPRMSASFSVVVNFAAGWSRVK